MHHTHTHPFGVSVTDASCADCRFSRDRPRFNDNLDVIKFLCKDLWTVLFRKQIDNLKTNHRVRGHKRPEGIPVPGIEGNNGANAVWYRVSTS